MSGNSAIPFEKKKLYRGLTREQVNSLGPLVFGFDIGPASVGWAVVAPQSECIVATGSHVFPQAEDERGRTNNQARRGARVARNRYATRKWRLKLLRDVFAGLGMLPLPYLDSSGRLIDPMCSRPQQRNSSDTTSPFALRARAWTETAILPTDDWARLLYSIVASRGYSYQQEVDEKAKNSEGESNSAEAKDREQYGAAVTSSKSFYEQHKETYGTLGNLIFHAVEDSKKPGEERKFSGNPFARSHKNRDGEYRFLAKRDWLVDEVRALFKRRDEQQNDPEPLLVPDTSRAAGEALKRICEPDGRTDAPITLCDFVVYLIYAQKPAILAANLEQTIGECELERSRIIDGKPFKGELRAPKNCFSNERRTWLQELNHLRIKQEGRDDPRLSERERELIVNLPYEREKVRLSDIRMQLADAGFPQNYRDASFNRATYRLRPKAASTKISLLADGVVSKKLSDFVKTSPKEARKTYTELLLTGGATFSDVRKALNVPESHRFSTAETNECVIAPDDETNAKLCIVGEPGAYEFQGGKHLDLLMDEKPLTKKSAGKYWGRLFGSAVSGLVVTLAEIRKTMIGGDKVTKPWVFRIRTENSSTLANEQETTATFPLEYEDPQTAEDEVLITMHGWHALRKNISAVDAVYWESLCDGYKVAANETDEVLAKTRSDKANLLDGIGTALTQFQSANEIRGELQRLAIPAPVADSLIKIAFSGYRNLSLKAIYKLLPSLESGENYTQAVESVYGKLTPDRTPKRFLDPLEQFEFKRHRFYLNAAETRDTGHRDKRYRDLANPVVARSFNRARAVLNALVANFGSPAYIAVETSRDLARSKKLRDKIAKEQEDNREKNHRAEVKAKQLILSKSGREAAPSKEHILKVRLCQEQDDKCVYTGVPINVEDVAARAADYQIDHIWPQSRTMDNSQTNKVLVHIGANQNKLNQTPYEWFHSGHGPKRSWEEFKTFVHQFNGLSPQKKERLLATAIDEKEFYARNLVDTRYVTRLFAKMLRDGLLFKDENTGAHVADAVHVITSDDAGADRIEHFHKARVRMPQGGLTATLRKGWKIPKDRDAGDLHHALDACVIAVTTPSLIQKVNNFHRLRETCEDRDGVTYLKNRDGSSRVIADAQRYFPAPWGTIKGGEFRAQLLARLSHDGHSFFTPAGEARQFEYPKYPDFLRQVIAPITVTRLIAKKSSGGEAHSMNPTALRLQSIRLTELTARLLEVRRYGSWFEEGNRILFAALATHLQRHQGDALAAFPNGAYTTDSGDTVFVVRVPLVCLEADELKALGIAANASAMKALTVTYEKISLDKLKLGAVETWVARGQELRQKSSGETGSNGKAAFTTTTTSSPTASNGPSPMDEFCMRNLELLHAIRDRLIDVENLGTKAQQKMALAKGIRKPETTDISKRHSRLQSDATFEPPMVRGIRVPSTKGNSGAIVRGGLVDLGDALCVDVYRPNGKFEFVPRYLMTNNISVRDSLDTDAALGNRHTRLHKGVRIRIEHQRLASIFRIIANGTDEHGNQFFDVEPMFAQGIFEGYFAYYEPTNTRPVLALHDRSKFAWPADGYPPERTRQRLFAVNITKSRKNVVEKSKEIWQTANDRDAQALDRHFTINKEVKIKVDDAKTLDVVDIDILGQSRVVLP